MSNEIITTLHPDSDNNTNLYPNIKPDNIPEGAISLNKLDTNVKSLLNNIGELKPSGVDTEANILAFTENEGIYIGSDTGNWYYWNGTQYVSGGLYIANIDSIIQTYNTQFAGNITYTDMNTAPYNSRIPYLLAAGSTSVNNIPTNAFDGDFNYLTTIKTKLTTNVVYKVQYFSNSTTTWYRFGASDTSYNAWKIIRKYEAPKKYEYNVTTALELKNAINEVIFTTRVDNVKIYLAEGDYDLLSVNDTDLPLGRNIHLIGTPKTRILWNYTGDDLTMLRDTSPFRYAMANNFKGYTLENITIIASNCRYCVHDEHDSYTSPSTVNFINCHFELDNSNNPQWNSKNCIGGGLGSNTTVNIDSCYFKGISNSSSNADVSYHNSASSTAKNKVIVKNSYFENTFRASSYGTSTSESICYVSNNNCKYEPFTEIETGGSIENIFIKKWNNFIRN